MGILAYHAGCCDNSMGDSCLMCSFFFLWPPLKLVWERYYALIEELFEKAEQENKVGNTAHSWAFKLVGFLVAIPLIILLLMVANRYSE